MQPGRTEITNQIFIHMKKFIKSVVKGLMKLFPEDFKEDKI